MTWEVLIPIIAKYGIPYAFELWKVITKYPVPTDEAWDTLFTSTQKTLEQYIEEEKARR
jgi:hypothetical protein